MSWTPSEKEIEAVLSLNASKRYEYWIKKVADQEVVWSLWQESGWALAGDDSGHELVPVWPHSRYAVMCANGAWESFQPKEIPLDAWLQRWIPGMTKDKVLVAVFPTHRNNGIPVEPTRLEHDLREELSNYE